MPDIYTKRFAVPASAIDANAHVNNLAYVEWMQDIAVEHSAVQGWPMQRYIDIGQTWVARSHFIEYLRPGFEGDPIALHTWISTSGTRAATRQFVFVRERDGVVLARAETNWVYVDFRTGRPVPMPDELKAAFAVVSQEDGLERLGIRGRHSQAAGSA